MDEWLLRYAFRSNNISGCAVKAKKREAAVKDAGSIQ
jgi:hypothetical protein